jgi:demethylmenaquinone methyltransferase/2-methoxy-6-polyprenyl-1,4-benzoquinol methylase
MDEISKNPVLIGQMFDEISPKYDLLNHLISAGQDIRWRKNAIKELRKLNTEYNAILDLAAGSGDLSKEMLNLSPGILISADLSLEMLKITSEKINDKRNVLIRADAANLPFGDNTFDLVGISFGVRNFEYLDKALTEIFRVLKPGGKFLTIEMFKSTSRNYILKGFLFYFNKLVPRVGKMISRSEYAYNYLFKSVATFKTIYEYKSLLKNTGFTVLSSKNNFLGIVYSTIASKPV